MDSRVKALFIFSFVMFLAAWLFPILPWPSKRIENYLTIYRWIFEAFRTWSMFSTAGTTIVIVAYFLITSVYNWRRQYTQSTQVQEAQQMEPISENELLWQDLQQTKQTRKVFKTFSRLSEDSEDIARFLESIKVFEYLEKSSLQTVLKGATLRDLDKNQEFSLSRTDLAFVTFGSVRATYKDVNHNNNNNNNNNSGLSITCTPGKTLTSYSNVMRAWAKHYNKTSGGRVDASCVHFVAEESSQILVLREDCFVALAGSSKLSVAHLTQVILSRFKRATMPIIFDYFNLTDLASSFLTYFLKKSHGASDVKLTDLLNACQDSFKTGQDERLLRVIFQYLVGTFDLDHAKFTSMEASLALLQSHISVKTTTHFDEVIQEAGEECRGAFLVLEGSLNFSFTDGSKKLSASVGDFVGIISALMGKCSSIQVTTGKSAKSSLVTYAIISQHLIEMISERDPKILFANIPDNRSTSQFIEFVDMSIDWLQCSCGEEIVTESGGGKTRFVVKVLHGRVREIAGDSLDSDDLLSKQRELGSGSFLGEQGIFSRSLPSSSSPVSSIKFLAVRQTEIASFPVDLIEGLVTLNSQVATSLLPKLLSRSDGGNGGSVDPIRTICLLPIGVDRSSPASLSASSIRDRQVQLAEEVCDGLQGALRRHNTSFTVIDNVRATELMGRQLFTTLGTLKMNEFLSSQEDVNKIIIYVADGIFSNWTRQCISQSDLVILIGDLEDEVVGFGDLERQMLQMNPLISVELCLLSQRQSKSRNETRKWLKNRPWIKCHHHLNTLMSLRSSLIHHSHHTHHHHHQYDNANVLPLDLIDNILRKSRDFHGYLLKRSGPFRLYQQKESQRRNSVFAVETSSSAEEENELLGYGRLCRRILGRSLGLVLGGGGARGLSHLGIIRALREAGIEIDLIGGTSIGAFIGGLVAREEGLHGGSSLARILDSIEDFSVRMCSKWRQALDLTYPATAWFTGHAFNRALWKHFGFSGIEDFTIPFFAVTTDLTRSRLQIHRSGPAWKYVRASMSLSGFLPPVCDTRDGTLLVDGGYLANVPIEQMQRGTLTELSDLVIRDDDLVRDGDFRSALSAAVVIAVDVGRTSDRLPIYYGDSLNGWRVLFQKALAAFKGCKPSLVPLTLDEIQFRLAYASSAGLLSRTLKRSHVQLAEELGSKSVPYVMVSKGDKITNEKEKDNKNKNKNNMDSDNVDSVNSQLNPSDDPCPPQVIYMRPSGIQQYGTLEFQNWQDIVSIGYAYGQEIVSEWRASGLIEKFHRFQGKGTRKPETSGIDKIEDEKVIISKRPRRSSI